ncbi:MAG TPA: hypothetical protein ENJ18_11865 [Nannocystis exedens]|nr:hypothetical protein [Nannocystis exedens]
MGTLYFFGVYMVDAASSNARNDELEPRAASQSAAQASWFRDAGRWIRRLILGIRPEEWLLLVLWTFSAGLCLRAGLGFDFRVVFVRYLKYFASFGLLLVLSSRLLFAFAESWHPRTALLKWVQRTVFGDRRNWVSMSAIDLEFGRGLLLLFINLSVYSNIKVRIPALNPEIGDALFLAWDSAIIGNTFAPWLEQYTQNHEAFKSFLADTYNHGYVWMIVLLGVGYLRRDTAALRWIFGATCLTYMTAILVTVGYPSMGPFFMEPERFSWVNESRVGGAQRFLRKVYAENLPSLQAGLPVKGRPFAGIAAFPSLHVGHMVVMGYISIRLVPLYALVMLVVTAVTFLATIAFGWHYAVDAIAGATIALLCSELVYRFAKRDRSRSLGWPRGG